MRCRLFKTAKRVRDFWSTRTPGYLVETVRNLEQLLMEISRHAGELLCSYVQRYLDAPKESLHSWRKLTTNGLHLSLEALEVGQAEEHRHLYHLGALDGG